MSKMTDFATWLLKELEARELTQTDLADYLGVSRQTVNYYIMKGDKKRPGDKVLYKIAKFFKMSPETIYRSIGVLPENKESEAMNEIVYLAGNLHEEDQQDVIEYMRHRLALAEKRGKSDIKKRIATVK